jgi:hypothetical protein
VRRAVALAALGLAGCLDSIAPDVGAPAREVCADEDSDPATPVHYQADVVDGIFNREDVQCDRCHTEGGASPIGLLVGGLDLGSYAGLRRGGAQGGSNIVIPGRPCGSVLYQKLEDGPPFGARMPLNGPPYLTEADVQEVADWIAEGARDD